jgi:Holliday junction DNA helicase RuvA
MISFLRGRVIELNLTSLVVDLNGIGYEVIIAPEIANAISLGSEVELFTSLVVREDSWTLYGFSSPDARTLFDELQGVTGIGPKVAHSLLAFFGPEELRQAIASSDSAALERVPGVGKKVASRIILELKDRFSQSRSNLKITSGKWREDLLRALTGLGYSTREAERAIDATINELKLDPAKTDLSELLRQTLTRARDAR